jgi:solute carrier family 40 (iron-regulated transporter), member 1
MHANRLNQEVDEDSRGAFSAVEAAWQNVFELCSYTSTIILSSPDQFGYPASMSVFAVLCAWALYTRFVKARRGHLLHWSTCLVGPEKGTRRAESLLLSGQRRPRYDA